MNPKKKSGEKETSPAPASKRAESNNFCENSFNSPLDAIVNHLDMHI